MINYFKKGRRKWIALGMAFAVAFTAVSWDMLRKEKASAKEKSSTSEYYDDVDLMNMYSMLEDSDYKMVELKDERTTNSTTYDMGNGFKKVVYYSNDVRFKDKDGKLVDFDSSLKQSGATRGGNSYKFESSRGDSKNYIPNDIEKTPVLMENDNYSIELSPVFNNTIFSKKTGDNEFENVKSMTDVSAIKETYDDIYDNEKTAVVGGAYVSKDKKVKLEYISSDKGVKENIVLYSKPQNNVWKFNLSLGSLVPKKDEVTGSISIYDGDNIVGYVEKPYMNDATNKAYSEDITYDIAPTNKQGEYELSMTVDRQYLDSSERQYPITIDPTITWHGKSELDDVYTITGKYKDTNFYSDSVIVFAAGDSSQGIYRSYLKIGDLKNKVNGFSIASAKLTVYEADGSSKGQAVEAYRIKDAFDKRKITFNTRPSYDTKLQSAIVTTGKARQASTFNITEYVRGVAKGTYENNGIMLKAKNDDKASQFTKFFSARHSVEQCRPKLEVVYYDKPATAKEVTLNKRFFKPGEALTVSWNGITSQALSLIQYRLAGYDFAKKEETGDIIPYSMNTKIGETSSGKKTLEESKAWSEGDYKIVVRGYDKFKMAGTGKGISFVIDGTKPQLGDVTITESSKEKYSTVMPTIKWSGVIDANLKGVEYSVNNSDYALLGNKKDGEVTLDNGIINAPGEYNIKVRAVDKSGNISEEKQFTYYYDSKVPEVTSFTTVPVEKGATKTPIMVWNVDDNNVKSIEYSINNGEYTSIGTTNSGAYTLEEGKIAEQGTYTIKLRAIDIAGNVSVEKEIKYEYNEGAVNNEKITIVPSSSTDNYTNTEPTIALAYMNDQSKVKIAYVLKLNGDVVEEKTVDANINNGTASYTLAKDIFNKSGDYNLEVKVLDEQNNVLEQTTKVYNYDTVSPEVKSARIINTSIQEVPTIELDAITDDKSGISNTAVYTVVPSNVETKDIKELDSVATASINEKKASFKLGEEVKQLDEGAYKVLVGIKDNAGNVSDIKIVGYYKINATFDGNNTIEAAYNDKTTSIDVSWKANENIKQVQLYQRRVNDEFQLVNEMDTTVEDSVIGASYLDIAEAMDYRIVFTYSDGNKKLSNIVSIEKTENNESDEDIDEAETDTAEPKVSYSETEVDEDEDGLADGYEVWELSCSPFSKDTDGDGFDDRYEVTTLGTSPAVFTQDKDSDNDGISDRNEYKLGTDPYLQDSDFDGINDGQDSEPLKTDIKAGKNANYGQEVHVGVYDKTFETVESDDTKTVTIQNIYTGKVKKVNEAGNVTSYYYDSNDNNIAVIGKANNEYVVNTYEYDKDDNLTYLTHNGFGYEFNYDEDGNMTEILAANRTLIIYKYNKSSSEDKEVNKSIMRYGNNYEYSYEYDDNGNTTAIKIDNKVAYEMSYDANGNMTKQVDRLNNVTYEYEYDKDGGVKSVKGSDGFIIGYINKETESYTDESGDTISKSEYSTGYADGALTRMCETTVRENTTDKVTNTTTVLIDNNKIEYVVNENANTETKTIKDTNGNDIIYTVTETKDDGTVEVRNVGGESFTYKYDKNDNITSISSSDEYEVTYEYDELEQLVRENDSKAGTTTLYSYDKGGNITGQKVYNYTIGQVSGTPIKTKNYEYGDSNWRDMLTSYNGQAITYDEIGNPLQYRDGMKMTWTNGRSLKSIIKGDLNTSYKYNKDGIRTQKTVNGKTTTYAVEDYNIVKETTDGENIWYMYDGKGDIVGLEIDGTSYYYDKNIQGDITGIYDTMGAKLVSYRYDAWGNVISVDGDKELASKNPFRYRGYYYDEEVGLYYLNSRYYDAETGRFVNADDVNLIPTMQSGIKGTNLFEYCDNNPVNKDDITGQWPSKKEVLKMLGKAWKFIWKSFWKIVDWIGRLQVLYSVFLPKSIKQKYTKKFIADQFVKLMTRSKARWFAFKNAVRTSRINWKIGGAIIVTLTVTVFTIIIYNCKHGIKAK